MYDVFLSHSHHDAAVVKKLAELLDDLGYTVWLDKWVMPPGCDWQQEQARGLNIAKTCAVCVGHNTPTGWFKQEIERALDRHAQDESFWVIPVILPDGDSSAVTDFLKLETWVEFRQTIDDPEALHRLTCGIKKLPPGRFRRTLEMVDREVIEARNILEQLEKVKDLLDPEVLRESQRKVVDEIIIGRGKK